MESFSLKSQARHLTERPEWVLGVLAVLYIFLASKPEYQLDEERFVAYADNLMHGFYAPVTTKFLWNGPVLPVLIAPFLSLGIPLFLFKLGNAGWLFGAIRHFRLAVSAHGGETWGRHWAWWVGTYFLLFDFSWLHLIMTETLALFCVAGAWRYWVASNSKVQNVTFRVNYKSLVLVGCYFGVLALTRFYFGYVLLFSLALSFLALVKQKSRLLALNGGFACCLALLICSPYLAYTWRLTGHFFYWGNTGGSQLYTLTLPEKNLLGDVIPLNRLVEYPEISPSAYRFLKKVPGNNEVDLDLAYRREALLNIRHSPYKVFQNWRANINRLIFDYPFSRFPGSHTKQSTGNLSLLFSLWFYALMPTLVMAWLNRRQIPTQAWLALGFVIISAGGLSLVSAYARFMLPLLPVLGYWISEVWRVGPGFARQFQSPLPFSKVAS